MITYIIYVFDFTESIILVNQVMRNLVLGKSLRCASMILLPTLKPPPYEDSIDVAKKVIEKRKTLPKVQELLKLVQH